MKYKPDRTAVVNYRKSVAGFTPTDKKSKIAEIKAKAVDKSGGSGIIKIGKSLGAAAKNYNVLLPDGTYSKLTEGTEITDIEVFAGKCSKKELRVKDFLVQNYGGKAENWQHTKGRGYVDYNGESKKAMLHWFEEETIGIVEMKVKGWSKK